MDNPIATDPIAAPIWRKCLALRVLAVNAIALLLALLPLALIDNAKLHLSGWVEVAAMLPAVAGFVAFVLNLAAGATDAIVHFVPTGRLRQILLQGDRSPEQIAKDFGESGYFLALLSLFIVLGLFFVVLLCALLLGGLSALEGVLAMVSGWPSWAVVIAVLLVLILLKK